MAGSAAGLRRRLLDATAAAVEGSPVSPSVRIAGPVDSLVGPGVAEHAEAVVREALSNVVRHARASAVTVTIDAGDELVIEVRDNGVGIDPSTARSGLRNLEQRAHDCGGELTITPHPRAAPSCDGGCPCTEAGGGIVPAGDQRPGGATSLDPVRRSGGGGRSRASTSRGGVMVTTIHWTRSSTRPSESRTLAVGAAFDDVGVQIGTVSRSGVVIDAGGVTIGVVWPDGGVYDYTGRRIGRTWV